MRDQVIGAVLGAVRMGLVVVALVIALVPIGRSAISGFCPGEGATAAPDVVVAAGVGAVLADVSEPGSEDPIDPNAPAPGDPTAEESDASVSEEPGDGVVVDEGPCGAGVDRCFPPLISAVLTFGEANCGDEAQSMLRSSMLPAFAISTVLLVGAWALRPRHGAPVLSRW